MKNKNLLYWIAAVFILLSRTASGHDVTINVALEHNAICNGQTLKDHPAHCTITDNGLIVGFDSWGNHTSLLTLTKTDPPAINYSGDCTASWGSNSTNTQLYPSVDCLPPPIDPPPTASTGEVLVDEWFSDLPWHQKLSTKDSNLIDVPFVMPFAAIEACKPYKDSPEKVKARCMLQSGIVNVMTMHRTDTVYGPNDVPDSFHQYCTGRPCVQVKLDIQRVHSTDTNSYEAEQATNNTHGPVQSLGFAITESTIFAPWRPWYMGHYCATDYDHMIDAVCYEDYFTTQLVAATEIGKTWLKDYPAVFYPQSRNDGTPGAQFGKWCKTGEYTCSMWLGKVKFEDSSMVPPPANCDLATCYTQVNTKTNNLDLEFKKSLSDFKDVGRYPWNWTNSNNEKDENAFDGTTAYQTNPFIGYYEMTEYGTDDSLYGITHPDNPEHIPYDAPHFLFKAAQYVLPKQCTQQDFATARLAKETGHGEFGAAIRHLKDCSLNFEIHTNGFINAWTYLYDGVMNDKAIEEIRSMSRNALDTNQYGRTMFMYAGVPEQAIPISFLASVKGVGWWTTHDKVYGASLYTQYLPLVNPADQTLAHKDYQDDFWHALLMSNHMNQTPDHFIRGIRGRTLWHNEYRSNLLFKAKEINDPSFIQNTRFDGDILAHVDFPAGFQKEKASSPYHGNTCDSCHVRNGSGIPVQPNGSLSALHQDPQHGMNQNYEFVPALLDYTYTNKQDDPHVSGARKQIVTPIKLVLIDPKSTADQCDGNGNTAAQPPYSNKIMNFYGNSFHVTQSSPDKPAYQTHYARVSSDDGFFVVDATDRQSADNNAYTPQRPEISAIDTSSVPCNDTMAPNKYGVNTNAWPANCTDVNGAAMMQAIASGDIGVMQLVGKRLGNTPLIEMIPEAKILDNVSSQTKTFTHAGCYGKVAGTRTILVKQDGNNNPVPAISYRSCSAANDCYISRWGWIGDRASLEDQIANAAHVEMNIDTTDGYNTLYSGTQPPLKQLVRYNTTLCGPADQRCQASDANSDLTEEEVRNMATYQRWIGIPNRSRYQIGTSLVAQGEQQFRGLGCSSCHVIDKIPFVANDNMLPDEERQILQHLQDKTGQVVDYPFVSYLGTDLLMHDMGYLSQVVKSPVPMDNFRKADGTIFKDYAGYIQKIRTPPLKGLRFNRFVTDSNHNTKSPIRKNPDKAIIPGCDFLLHDGRACDAIEAAFLHDGPAVKQLGMIDKLNSLTRDQLAALRAFLYSL